MQYKADANHIYVLNPPFGRKDEIKRRLSGVWSDTQKRGKGWRFPRNLHAYRELYKFFPELRDDPNFMKDYGQSSNNVKYWLDVKTNTTHQFGLREYQNQDVNYLVTKGSCLVLNEPRTGKTPTMISVIKLLGKKKNLVVCPSSLVLNWAKEFEKWYPQCEVVAISGDKKKRVQQINHYALCVKHKLSVLIISKDTLKIEINGQLEDSKFDTMIVDEAHYLRNYKSKQSQAVFSVYAKYKYALTGTPSVKHGSDIYGLLHFINPEQFSSYWQFTERYWQTYDNGWGVDVAEEKAERREELKTIMALNSVQRKRKDVMTWLPAQTRQTISVELGTKQLKYYEKMLDTFEIYDEDLEHGVDTLNVLSQLMRLRQICLDPRLLGFKEVGAKTTALLEFAEEMNDPFVVMTMFSSYFDLIKEDLEKLGKKVAIIDGSVSKTNRQRIVELFQRGNIDILLANIIAAGTGLTLDRSDTIVFLDKSFSPADNEQAEDRIVPTTESRYHPINVISFVADGTVDSRINDILERKEDLTKIINKPELLGGVLK
jgi:SNF2 family DNA or RNA helicase